jgi:hypothetical protein
MNTGEKRDFHVGDAKLFCAYGERVEDALIGAYRSKGTAKQIVDAVLEVASGSEELQGKNLQIAVYRDPGIRNAAAGILPQGDRVIFVDGRWTGALRTWFSKWANRGVFAHEVGHHYHWDESQNHVRTIFSSNVEHLVKDNPDWLQELEADAFAGFVLAKMDATLEAAHHTMDALNAMSKGRTSKTHPCILDRRKAVHAGWKLGGGAAYSNRADWCPCGCQAADGRYDEGYDKTPDDYRNEAEIYRSQEPPPVPPEDPPGAGRSGRTRYELIPVPCRHPHPMDPGYKLHPYDQAWERVRKGHPDEGDP